MDACTAAKFPQTRVRLVVAAATPARRAARGVELRLGARFDEALVEEQLGDAQDRGAVAVVLFLLEGLVAEPHGPHALVAGQAVDEHFVRSANDRADAVQGLQLLVARRPRRYS